MAQAPIPEQGSVLDRITRFSTISAIIILVLLGITGYLTWQWLENTSLSVDEGGGAVSSEKQEVLDYIANYPVRSTPAQKAGALILLSEKEPTVSETEKRAVLEELFNK